jgi:cation diffusion facilitator family transporter
LKNRDGIREMLRISAISILLNAVLSAAKLVTGLLYNSGAVLSDAAHSLSDAATTVLVMIGLKISAAPADKNHNYGHEKIEAVFSTLLAVILFVVAVFLCIDSVSVMLSGERAAELNAALLIVTGASIAVKELLYRYTMKFAKKYGSQSLKADAWHHRSDAASSVAVLIGLGTAMLFPGLFFMEQVAAAVVSLLIAKVAVQIYLEAINKLIDRAADPETVAKMSEVICAVPGVARIDSLKTRLSTYKIYVDIEIAADGRLSLYKAHDIAQQVHDLVELKYTEFNIKHINVHVNPDENFEKKS